MESDMNGVGSSMSPPVNVPAAAGKRKRSEDSALDLSKSRHAPTKKPVEKVHINYLRRVLQDDIEIVSEEDSLDIMKSLITAYEDILRRNESFAANCGAKPLSQTLVTRFLRMFDSNVKILQPSPKPGVTVSWLDVVEYAKVHDDFALNQVYHGDRVCQLSIKGCKIEISEDDFLLIKSGQPQRLFPPQPIAEDEEKELATVGILTDRLRAIIQECDTVSGRARMLNQRLLHRKSAISSRRAMSAASVNGSSPSHNGGRQSPAEHLTVNGVDDTTANGGNSDPRRSPSSSGFVAVNHQSAPQADGVPTRKEGVAGAPSHEVIEYLEKRFLDVRERKRHKSVHTGTGRHSLPSSRPRQSLDTSQHADHLLHGILSHQSATGPSFNSSANNRPVHNNDGRELIKAKMIAHVEGLNKGDRIDPPCDRCRRLPGMECRKNLTACMGCTRKHARCAWLKVTEDEIVNSRPGSVDEPAATGEAHSSVEAVEDATDSLNDGGTPSPNVDQRENADSVAVDVGAKLEDVEMSTS